MATLVTEYPWLLAFPCSGTLAIVNRMRQNPVQGRQRTVAMLLALWGGAVAVLAGASPAGWWPVDAVLVFASAAALAWASATAPWWLIAVFCGGAAVISGSYPWFGVAMVGLVAAAFVGANRRNLPWVRVLATVVGTQALLHSHLRWFHGASALAGALLVVPLFVWGVRRKTSSQRKLVGRVAWALAAGATVLLFGFLVAALSARAPLREGSRAARQGLDQLNQGKVADAAQSFAQSAAAFARADDSLGALWAQGARLLPVVAQQRAAAADVVSVARSALADAASALRKVDPDSVRLVNGRIDIDAVRALEQPFVDLNRAIDRLAGVTDDVASPWLVAPLQREVVSLQGDLRTNQLRARNALHAVQVAPRMLGADGVRRYFIAFTTPAEARGLGGFMGTWAELTIDHGAIDMTRYGRSEDVNGEGEYAARRVEGLDELVGQWGRFGLNSGPGGTTATQVWSNITMAPHFPAVAEAIAQLYPQSGGSPIDGVFLLDTKSIAALMRFTGPIEVEGTPTVLTADTAEAFLLRDQYLVTDIDARKDLLQTIAKTTVDRLLGSTLPPPADMAAVFAPLAAERRLMAWSANADEEQLFADVKMDGSFVRSGDADGVAVTVDNASASKLEAYLDMVVKYETIDGPGGVHSSRVTVTFTNSAPSSGLPDYVIGNALDLPKGTERLWVSVYTASPMVAAELDGQAVGMQTAQVFGWYANSKFFDIPSGGTRTLVLETSGVVNSEVPLRVINQPLASVHPVEVTRG